MTLNGVMAVTLRYFTKGGKPALQKTICGGMYARVCCILVRVRCRRKVSSRSLSHLLMSFLSHQLCANVTGALKAIKGFESQAAGGFVTAVNDGKS